MSITLTRSPRALIVLGTVLLLVVLSPLRSAADTSQSTANAASATLAGGSLVTTGTESASNDGMSPTDNQFATPALSVLGLGTLLNNGTLAQRAVAFADGTSAGCAGATGNSGSVTIQPDGTCVVAAGSTQGVQVNLAGGLVLKADAITASCFAKSDGTVTASAGLLNAKVTNALGIATANLPANPSVNQTTSLLGLVTITMNAQSSTGAGQLSATALQVRLIGSLVGVDIGHVTCGTNVVTAPTPAIPLPVIPIALAAAAVVVATPQGRRVLAQAKALVVR